VEKADFLPDFNLQYGFQKVNGASGFYNYLAGISIPILSGSEYAEAKAAKIEKEMAVEAATFAKEQVQTEFLTALQNYKKWKDSWKFYRDEVLPLLEEQRQGSFLAFNEGAIEYVAFIQNLDNAVQTELKALEAYKNFQIALAEIQFYLND
jgi:cobalt-zinc-cadmium resistance protein CzcA